jgi:hypothetical protein
VTRNGQPGAKQTGNADSGPVVIKFNARYYLKSRLLPQYPKARMSDIQLVDITYSGCNS